MWSSFVKKLSWIAFLWKSFKARVYAIFEKVILIPYRAVVAFIDKWFWKPLVRLWRFITGKISYWVWKAVPSRSSEVERERYRIFIDSLGGWRNISEFTCRSKSWHLKVVHSFLINWDDLNLFNITVLSYSWPHLDLSLGSYSKWMFKRLKRFTNMPKIKKVKPTKFR